ncbi:MAG: type III-A CRISPR-associated RAMP protein Csm3 [Cyclobacteriaceae bacterium]
MKLVKKIILAGKITLITGLHIGGAKSSMEIGGIDSPVIKTSNNVPYIPGSSLKGKIRSLLAKKEGAINFKSESDTLKTMFGYADGNKSIISRLIFRDALLDIEHFNNDFERADLALDFSEEKVENTIDRKTGTSIGGLRHIERVPAGAIFYLEIVVNLYDGDNEQEFKEYIKGAFKLLEDDYLGGSGSRGYGKVKIELYNEIENPVEHYFKV